MAATKTAHTPDEVAFLSVDQLLRLFAAGTLTPEAVLEAQIGRIQRFNPTINAVAAEHFDEARRQAKESTARWAAGTARPLEGVTVAVKDEHERIGWRVTMGSKMLAAVAEPCEHDAPIIDMLAAAGCVFHMQTTVPEFYLWISSNTSLWGVTRNPWRTACSPGGSSSGSGAALAAGFTTLATGSDMAGSVRIPASQCGLFGLKAPFGRVPSSDNCFETAGPLARSMSDLVHMSRVVIGPHPLIQSSLRPKLELPTSWSAADVRGWRVAVDFADGLCPLDPSVRASLQRAVDVLRKIGVTVDVVDVGFDSSDIGKFACGLLSTGLGMLVEGNQDNRDDVEPATRYWIDRDFTDDPPARLGPQTAMECDMLMAEYNRRVQTSVFTKGYRALLMATLATSEIPAEHGANPKEDHVVIEGVAHKGLKILHTWPWNLLGRHPVVDVPCGLSPTGVPIGIQVVGDTFDDVSVFQLASALSSAPEMPRLFSGELFPAATPCGAVAAASPVGKL